jgi:hypothetical protein
MIGTISVAERYLRHSDVCDQRGNPSLFEHSSAVM